MDRQVTSILLVAVRPQSRIRELVAQLRTVPTVARAHASLGLYDIVAFTQSPLSQFAETANQLINELNTGMVTMIDTAVKLDITPRFQNEVINLIVTAENKQQSVLETLNDAGFNATLIVGPYDIVVLVGDDDYNNICIRLEELAQIPDIIRLLGLPLIR